MLLNLFRPKMALNIYFLGIISGALAFLIVYNVVPSQFLKSTGGLVGASAGIRALIIKGFLLEFSGCPRIRCASARKSRAKIGGCPRFVCDSCEASLRAFRPSFCPLSQRRHAGQEILPVSRQAIALLLQGDDAGVAQFLQALVEDRGGGISAPLSKGPETKGAVTQFPQDSQGPSAAHEIEQGHDRSTAPGASCGPPGLGGILFHEIPCATVCVVIELLQIM